MAGKAEQNALPKEVSLKQIESAWNNFVDRVERGEIVDPLGQYVSKKTVVGADKFVEGARSIRPKYSALVTRDMLFSKNSGRLEVVSLASSGTDTEALRLPDPTDNPPSPCPDGGCVVFPVPAVPPTFVSSVGRGGGYYIHDLKLVTNTDIRNISPPDGYEKLDIDLNRGAGGSYIYLCFTRNPSSVLNGLEYYQYQPGSDPREFLRKFTTQEGSFFGGAPEPGRTYFPIWVPNQNPYTFWDIVDLNAGAGGKYIYSYQSRRSDVNGFSTNTNPIVEIGIIAGNNDRIQPPLGWKRYDYGVV